MTQGPSETKLKVFISYSRKDSSEFAEELVDGLQVAGFAPSLDRHDIAAGEDWEARLGSLIQEADTVLYVVSPEAVRSERCQWEIDKTLALSKRLLPVIFIAVSDTEMPKNLSRLQFVHFDKGRFARSLSDLALALRQDLDWVREHTRLGEAAVRWDARSRPESLLLRGDDLAAARGWVKRRRDDAPPITNLQHAFITASEEAEAARTVAESQKLAEINQSKRLAAINLYKHITNVAWDLSDVDPTTSAQLSAEAIDALSGSLEVERLSRARSALYMSLMVLMERAVTSLETRAITHISISPAGRYVLIALRSGAIWFWNVASGTCTPVLGPSEQPRSVFQFSHDETLFVCGEPDGGALAFSTSDPSRPMALPAQEGSVTSAAFAPNRHLLAIGDATGAITLWNTQSPNAERRQKPHAGPVSLLKWAPSGRLLASAASDRSLNLWNVWDGVQVARTREKEPIRDLQFRSDSKRILCRLQKEAVIRDVAHLKHLATLKPRGELWRLAGQPDIAHVTFIRGSDSVVLSLSDGQKMVMGKHRKWYELFDSYVVLEEDMHISMSDMKYSWSSPFRGSFFSRLSERGEFSIDRFQLQIEPLRKSRGHYQFSNVAAARLPDARDIVFSSLGVEATQFCVAYNHGRLALWDPLWSPLCWVHTDGLFNHPIFSADDSLVAARAERSSTQIDVFDTLSGRRRATVKHVNPERMACAFSRDGSLLAAFSHDNSVRVWGMEENDERHAYKTGHSPVLRVAFTPEGSRLVSISSQGSATLWRVGDGAAIATWTNIAGHTPIMHEDTRTLWIAAPTDAGTIHVWNSEGQTELRKVGFTETPAIEILFSPSGGKLALRHPDASVSVWDLLGGRMISRIPSAGMTTTMQFSSDGRMFLLSELEGPTPCLAFETTLGERILHNQLRGAKAAFAGPNAERLVTVTESGLMTFWRSDHPEEAAKLQVERGGLLINAGFSSRGRFFYLNDNTLVVFDALEIKQVLELPSGENVGFSLTDRYLLYSNSRSLDRAANRTGTFLLPLPQTDLDLATLARSRLARKLSVEQRTRFGLPQEALISAAK